MAAEPTEQSPVPSDRAPAGGLQLVSPYDQRVYTVDSKYADVYREQGFVPPSAAQVRSENIMRNYEHGWRHKVAAVGEGVLQGVPGATTLASKILPTEAFQSLQQDTALNQQAHPYYNIGGRVLGGLGTVAALTASGGAIGGALGFGGAAAAEGTLAGGAELGSALLGETGAAAAEGSTLGAEFSTPFAAGAGEQAANLGAEGAIDAAGNTLKVASGLGKVAAPSWAQSVGAVGKGIAENAAIGGVFKAGEGSDDAAMAHALDPNGQEHLGYSWKNALDNFIDGATTGAEWGAAFETLGPALRGAAGKLAPLAQKQLERGLFDTEKLNEAMQGVADTPIMKTVRDMKLVEQTPKKRAFDVDAALKAVEGKMNLYKDALGKDYRVAPELQAQLGQTLNGILGDTPLGQKIAASILEKPANFQEMQQYRRQLYDAIDYTKMELPENQAYLKAADALKQSMLDHAAEYEGVAKGQSGLVNEWNALDEQYHTLSVIKTALKKDTPGSNAPWVGTAFGVAAASKVALNMIGLPAVGTTIATGVGLVKSVQAFKKFVTDSKLGAVNQSLAKGFDASASLLAKSVDAGLYGGYVAYKKDDLAQNYPQAAAKVNAWMQDRQGGVANLRQALDNAQVPGSIATGLANQAAAKHDYLAQTMPRPPRVAPDIVTHSQPDLAAQQKWLGKYRSVQDPKYAIAHPTASNLEVLQKFYPSLYADTQAAVLEQVQNNPNLPIDSKLWASRILGRPITPAATHMFYTVLTAARAQSDQAAAQSAHSGGGSKKTVQSSGTRLDGLQNPED